MRYHGTPDVDEDDRFERGWWATGDSIFAVGEPAGSDVWYPVNGHPLDKATYTMSITVPEPYEVVANGLLDSVAMSTGAAGNPSTITYTWENPEPTASYLVIFNAAELDIAIGDGSGRHHRDRGVPARPLPNEERLFDRVPEMVEIFDAAVRSLSLRLDRQHRLRGHLVQRRAGDPGHDRLRRFGGERADHRP